MRKRIRLTEADLHRIVNRSVKQVLRESSDSGMKTSFPASTSPAFF